MKKLVLLALIGALASPTIAEELPQPYVGIAAGGHYCESEALMLDFLEMKDLVERGELAPFQGFPPGCGQLIPGTPLYFEPMRWVQFPAASVLLARVTDRENKALYIYMDVRITPDA